MTKEEEFEIVRRQTGVGRDRIELRDDGFLSRGYVVDGGRLVFKFRRHADMSYADEVRSLQFLNKQDLGVNLQRVALSPLDGSWLALYGVSGKSLDEIRLDNTSRAAIGKQLGEFLRKLHALTLDGAQTISLDSLIHAWQKRYAAARKTLEAHFSTDERTIIDRLMMQEMPHVLHELGEKNVLSHADLGNGNIFVDSDGQVGIIDCGGCAFMDEASDFMDVRDDTLCAIMLDAYGADDTLRAKVDMQRRIRPIFTLDVYAGRGDAAVQEHVDEIRARLGQ